MISTTEDDPVDVAEAHTPPTLVVVIAGPTAVGKSDTAMALAELLPNGAEIVSADSVQVYKHLDIGSNKPSLEEQQRCRTHLIDWREPSDPCSAGEWTHEALRVIDDISARGLTPIVCGGSSMYIDWLVHGAPNAEKSEKEAQAAISDELQQFKDVGDWDNALALLTAIDPERAGTLTRNNWGRLSRQLEIARSPPTRSGRSCTKKYDFRPFFLAPEDRQAFFRRIDTRCLRMLQSGLFEEVAGLLETGTLDPSSTPGLAIGYRQVIEYLARPDPQERDTVALEQFLRSFGSATRSYARSQVQWFSRDAEFLWLRATPQNPSVVAQEILSFVALSKRDFERQKGEAQSDQLKEQWLAQGKAHGPAYSSVLEQGASTIVPDLALTFAVVDACTKRVPDDIRRTPNNGSEEASKYILSFSHASGVPYGKVYWNGRHRIWGWGHPLGKLPKSGLQILEALGWRQVKEDDTSCLPVFCWCARTAGDFPGRPGPQVCPYIHPFPQEFTRSLDDKMELMRCLRASSQEGVLPDTWSAVDFIADCEKLQEEAQAPAGDDSSELWFLKHALGVKGNSVYVFPFRASVLERLTSLGCRGQRPFIVQKGVHPPSLRNDRRWTLRVHAMLLLPEAQDMLAAPELYCHSDMIVLEHGKAFTMDTKCRAAHISSAGDARHWPKPYLLQEDSIAAQAYHLTEKAFLAAISTSDAFQNLQHVESLGGERREGCLCQVFGLDFTADSAERLWLLEVNSYPAIASGTLQHVDVSVFTKLIRDVVNLVVLPRTDGKEMELGNFKRLKLDIPDPSNAEDLPA